jgi:hypothetical protein
MDVLRGDIDIVDEFGLVRTEVGAHAGVDDSSSAFSRYVESLHHGS